MRKTVHKVFFIWDFDKEERWLNEMAAKGLCLMSVGYCRYDFEECRQGEYRICMQMLENSPRHAESEAYIAFVEDTGAEHVGTLNRWVYFRKKASEGPFELYSDIPSRTKHLTRIIGFILFLTALNLFMGAYNLLLALLIPSSVNFLGVINLALGIFSLSGALKLRKKRNRLRREGYLFE